MLGLDNPTHLIFLLVLLLLVFGAKRLPEMGRSLGSGMRGFKASLSGEQSHQQALEQPSPGVGGQPSSVAANSSEPGSSRS
jgi:sec-independent protein translocase protein TatA